MQKKKQKERFRLCPICKDPIENIPFPHFHVIEGEIINSEDAYNDEINLKTLLKILDEK